MTKRARDAHQAFASLAPAAVPAPSAVADEATPEPEVAPAADVPVRPVQQPDEAPVASRTTVKLSTDDALLWEELALRLRRRLGRRVHQAEIVRVAMRLVADDPALFEQVAAQLPAKARES